MVKQISIFLSNEKGMLNKVCGILSEADVDIRALTVAETEEYGLLRMIVSDPDAAVEALTRGDISAIEHDVLAVEVSDRPGGLYKVTNTLSSNNINIEYLYAFVSRNGDKAYVVLRTDDMDAAQEMLEKNDIKTVSEEEIESI